jgi:hypothetical protein
MVQVYERLPGFHRTRISLGRILPLVTASASSKAERNELCPRREAGGSWGRGGSDVEPVPRKRIDLV